MARIPLLTTDGDAHARGLAHGRRFAREVADNLRDLSAPVRGFGPRPRRGLRRSGPVARRDGAQNAVLCGGDARHRRRRRPDRGAIALLNARYELAFTLFGEDAKRKERAGGGRGRTAAPPSASLPQATADRHTWLGQNWDWLEGVHGRTFVLRVRRKDRPSFVCLTEAGIAGGKMGVNECGIGLVENGLASSHDGTQPYQKPFHMRCREVLDADRYEDALAAGDGHAAHLLGEFRHRRRRRRDRSTSRRAPITSPYLHPDDGIVTHSNHFVDAGPRRVADGEDRAQHALPRRPACAGC